MTPYLRKQRCRQTEPVRRLQGSIVTFTTSTTTPHTPATLFSTKKIPFNLSFAQTLVWVKPFFGAKNTAFNPELGSTSPVVLFDNTERPDKLVNRPAVDVPDRGGDPLYSWRQMMAKSDEVRQNLIPLSKQYQMLTAAQADIVNIPEGSTTYYRSPDDSALAIEVTNVGGTPTAAEREMPSSQAVDSVRGLTDNQGENLFSVVSKNGFSLSGYKDERLYADEFQRLYSSDAGLEFGGSIIDNNPPDGWRSVIYYRNGLVVCGQRNDGMMIGFGEGGSGDGSTEPGDMAADYDSIRDYTGTTMVWDVVGQHTGGRSAANPDDMTSGEIPGGIPIDVLGRRWYRQVEFVSYDTFMASRVPDATLLAAQVALAMGNRSPVIAYLSGAEVADAATQSAHRYANPLNIPVRQNDGVFLVLVDHEAEVRIKTSLGGSIILTSADLGVNEIRRGPLRLLDPSAPEPKRIFNTKGKERTEPAPAELAMFNTSYSQYLKKGSNYLPYPKLYPYYGGTFYALSNEVETYRNGNRDNPRDRTLYREFSRIGRNGVLTEQVAKDVPTGSVGCTVIIPKEDDFLEFERPRFIELGDSHQFLNIEASRPMVHVKSLVHASWQAVSTSLESRVVISARGVFDVFCEYGETTRHPTENDSYVIYIRDTCNVHIDNYHGLHGWGSQGYHGIKSLHGSRDAFNRIDFHSFGYDVFFKDLTVKDRQINLQGGNEWSIGKLRLYITRISGDAVEYFPNYATGMRQDYVSDCDGIPNIDGAMVMQDRGLLVWYNTTQSFDLVRIIDMANSLSQGTDSKLLPTITTRSTVFNFAGTQTGRPNNNFEFCVATVLRSQFTDYAVAGRKTLLPDNITIDGMTAISVQPTQNAVTCGIKLSVDLYQNTVGSRNKKGSDGTNARITLCNLHSVINNSSIELTTAQAADTPGDAANWTADYLNSDYSWVSRVTLENCILAIIHAPGAKAVVDIHGGKLTRVYINGNGSRCRVTGIDTELIPDVSGVTHSIADKTLVTGYSWLSPTSGATHPGTLCGSGNGTIGESAKALNLPAKAFIEK